MAGVMQVQYLRDLGVKIRDVKDSFKRVHITYPLSWLALHLMNHWTKSGARKYGYAPRSGEPGSGRQFRGSYTERKLAQQLHTRPLEYTGRGRAMAVAGKKARGRRRGASAVLPAPVFNRPTQNPDINMRRELTTITPDESVVHESEAQKRLGAELRRIASRHA